ncbi:polycystin-2-like [Branchiostoma lanceolatum]|uniref:polycystin-2-like n=1 Tax=Branchiostoma lanceolatum TaxID=7740 RepID=UPI0034528558
MEDQAPPDEAELEVARTLRNKELKMYSIIREIVVYLMYIFIIVVISYFSRDENAYRMRQTIQETFLENFEQIKTIDEFWSWAQGSLLDGLQPGQWYNSQAADNIGPLVADKISMLVGYAILRQLRVKEGGCESPVPLLGLTCTSEYSWEIEEHGNYRPGWEDDNYNRSTDAGRLEYSYTQSGEIESYPFEGIMAIYTGGGYVVHLDGNKEELVQRMQQLQHEGWLDRNTRAVVVEFSVYNAQVNLFSYARFLLEVLPSGNMMPSYKISPVRLLSYYSSLDTLKLVCQVVYFGFLLYFMYRELRELCRDRTKYFADIWNWIELFVIAVSIAAIVAYFYKLVVTNSLLDDLARANGRNSTYVNLQYVTGWNQLYEYLVACLVYAATLKLFRLLRFNRRMSLLSSTIRHCSKELTAFTIIIGVLLVSFSMLGYLVLGIHLKDFSSFVDAFETLVGTTMGYFEVDEIIAAKPFMGTIIFVTFTLSMAFVILNVFIGWDEY